MNSKSAVAVNSDRGKSHSLHAAASAAATTLTTVSVAASEFWTTNEVAAYLRCEPQTIRKNLSNTGAHHGLKPCRFGRRWLFKAADVRASLMGA